LVEA
jgi:hypothetical protein